jgi:hypothetical protein
MKIVILALLGFVSAEQLMKIEQDSDASICAVPCGDKLTCCPENTVCGDGNGACYPKRDSVPAQLLTKETDKAKPIIDFDTEADCTNFVKEFS